MTKKTLSDVLAKLQYHPTVSGEGMPWTEALGAAPESPMEQARWAVRAVSDAAEVLKDIHSVDFVCVGFDPSTFYQTDKGLRIPALSQKVARAGRLPDELAIQLNYAPPEVTAQSAKDVGPATDVFHLGALFYHLATRRFPGAVTQEGLRACRYNLPRFRVYNAGFPVGFQPVIAKSLKLNPRRRFQSIDEFLFALSMALEQAEMRSTAHVTPRFDIGAKTALGTVKGQLCPNNQDAIYPDPEKGEALEITSDSPHLLAVADGVTTSTYGSGDKASQIVIQHIQKAEASIGSSHSLDEAFETVKAATQNATTEISATFPAEEAPRPELLMTSTVIAALVVGNQVAVGNTGNSKACLVTRDSIEQINLDDDVGHARWRSGMPPEQVQDQRHNRSLRRVVGASKIENGKIVPDLKRARFTRYDVRLLPGEWLLLCSDGLIEPGSYLNFEEVHQIILANHESSAQDICELLVEAADARQKPPSLGDNISCILLKADAAS